MCNISCKHKRTNIEIELLCEVLSSALLGDFEELLAQMNDGRWDDSPNLFHKFDSFILSCDQCLCHFCKKLLFKKNN